MIKGLLTTLTLLVDTSGAMRIRRNIIRNEVFARKEEQKEIG